MCKNIQVLSYRDIFIFHKNVTQLGEELDEYHVFYMFNHFPAEPMRTFMQSIVESLQRNRRMVYVVYHNPVHADVCREEGFVVQKEVLTPTYFRNDKRTLILEYRPKP